MKTTLKKISTAAFAIILIASFTNCKAVQNANNKQKGAAIGAAGGAILGAIIGTNVGYGNSELGAVIGAAVGGGTGILVGNRMDKQAQKILDAAQQKADGIKQ